MDHDDLFKPRQLRQSRAVPVRVVFPDKRSALACTMDVSRDGARLNAGGYAFQVNETVEIQYARDRAKYRVVWVGDGESGPKGQVGVRCVEEGKGLLQGSQKKSGTDAINAAMRGAAGQKKSPPNRSGS